MSMLDCKDAGHGSTRIKSFKAHHSFRNLRMHWHWMGTANVPAMLVMHADDQSRRKASSPPPAQPDPSSPGSDEDGSISAQPGAEGSKGAWLRGMVAGMSERTKEAFVPSIKNGRALLKSLGGMQISGGAASEQPTRDASPEPEPASISPMPLLICFLFSRIWSFGA